MTPLRHRLPALQRNLIRIDSPLSSGRPRINHAIGLLQLLLCCGLFLLPGITPQLRAAVGDSIPQAAPSSPSIGDTIAHDAVMALHDAGALAAWFVQGTHPLSIAGAAGGAAVLVATADDNVRQSVQRHLTSTGDHVAQFGNFFGTGAPGGIAAIALYGTGLLADKPEIRLAGLHVVQSLAYAGIITTTLKIVIGRERPFLNNGPDQFHGFSTSDNRNSMPSGHTTVAFAICSSLAADIDNPYATVGLYGLATVTAWSRIYSDRHWLSDVFLGAAIGTACGYGTVHLHTDRAPGDAGLYITPGPGTLSLSMVF